MIMPAFIFLLEECRLLVHLAFTKGKLAIDTSDIAAKSGA
jgi:hypothetical protein